MSREPGDVIAFRCGENEYRGIVDVDGRPYTTDPRAQGCRADEFTNIRPLVVVDPEDREQVEQLTEAIDYCGSRPQFNDRLQDALRSLIAPPKPPEPTGLGAVVEDEKGLTWVRRHPGGLAWVNGYERWAKWVDIAAVKVLSEGVTS